MSDLYQVTIEAVNPGRRRCTMRVEAVNSELQTVPSEESFAVGVLAVIYTSAQLGRERLPLAMVRGAAKSAVPEIALFEPMRHAVESGTRLRTLFQESGPWVFLDEELPEMVQVSVLEEGAGERGYPRALLEVTVEDPSWLSLVVPGMEVRTIFGPGGILDFLDA